MICYRDTSFCRDAPQCKNKDGCHRYFSEEERVKAVKWWGSKNVPVAVMPFRDTCDKWEEVE